MTAAIRVVLVLVVAVAAGCARAPDRSQQRARAAETAATIAAMRADEVGWAFTPSLVARPAGQAHLAIVLHEAGGAPVARAWVEAEVRELATDRAVAFALVETAAGRYEVDLPGGDAGGYAIAVKARRDGDHYAGVATVELGGAR